MNHYSKKKRRVGEKRVRIMDSRKKKKLKMANFSKPRELICRVSWEGNLRDKGGQKSWQLQYESVLKAQ